jgi:hypothetical protein
MEYLRALLTSLIILNFYAHCVRPFVKRKYQIRTRNGRFSYEGKDPLCDARAQPWFWATTHAPETSVVAHGSSPTETGQVRAVANIFVITDLQTHIYLTSRLKLSLNFRPWGMGILLRDTTYIYIYIHMRQRNWCWADWNVSFMKPKYTTFKIKCNLIWVWNLVCGPNWTYIWVTVLENKVFVKTFGL